MGTARIFRRRNAFAARASFSAIATGYRSADTTITSRSGRSSAGPYGSSIGSIFAGRHFLAGRKWRPAKIEPIDDPYGPADDLPDLDVIVVSAERYPVAIALNEARAAKSLRRLEIRAVPMLLAQDGLPIASRRIRAGVIDRTGRRRTPLRIGVGTDNTVKVRAVRRVMAALSFPARVRGVRVRTDVPEQPFGDE